MEFVFCFWIRIGVCKNVFHCRPFVAAIVEWKLCKIRLPEDSGKWWHSVEALSAGIRQWLMAQYSAKKLWLQVLLNFTLLHKLFLDASLLQRPTKERFCTGGAELRSVAKKFGSLPYQALFRVFPRSRRFQYKTDLQVTCFLLTSL